MKRTGVIKMKGCSRYLISFCLCLCLLVTKLHADINVGVVMFYPPFVYNTEQGFDIDLIKKICQHMKTKCTLMPMTFEDLFKALDNRRVDIIIGGLNINNTRLLKYIFSYPYLLNKGQFLTFSHENIKTIDDLKNKKVGVITGSANGDIYYNYLTQKYNDTFKIVPYSQVRTFISDFENGTISSVFIHSIVAHYWVQNSQGALKTLGDPIILGAGDYNN